MDRDAKAKEHELDLLFACMRVLFGETGKEGGISSIPRSTGKRHLVAPNGHDQYCTADDVAGTRGGSSRSESLSAGLVGEFRDLLGKHTDLLSAPRDLCEALAARLRRLADAITSLRHQSDDEAQHVVNTRGSEATCATCEEEPVCEKPCPAVLAQLPGIHAGRGRKENASGLYEESLKKRGIRNRPDIFHEYKKCEDIFRSKQWDVICLHYRDGLDQAQIAARLGKSRSAISGLLTRARKRKKKHDEKLRAEYFRLRRVLERSRQA